MTCQCRFSSFNKCTTVRGDADNGKVYKCVRARDIWEAVLSAQFCNEPKTALYNKVYSKIDLTNTFLPFFFVFMR